MLGNENPRTWRENPVSPACPIYAWAVIPPATCCTTSVRVRYCECDPMGVAHHASYVPWLEIGRTELLRSSGVSYASLEAGGLLLVIVALEVKYRRPVRYDDVVQIRTTWSGGGRVKILHQYELTVTEREGNPCDIPVAAAATTLGAVDRGGRIRELPEWLVWRS